MANKKEDSCPKLNPRLIFGVFFLMLITLLLSQLSQKSSELRKGKETKEVRSASLRFEPKEGLYKKGEKFEVEIILNTGDYETDATDVRFEFNSKVLAAEKILPGIVYDDYPAQKVNTENGLIVINGITSLTKTFKGEGVFATVVFKGISPGKSPLMFEFSPSSTTDCNVVATKIAKDVLGGVEGAAIEIN